MTSLTMQNTPDDDVIDQKPKPQTENFVFIPSYRLHKLITGRGGSSQ